MLDVHITLYNYECMQTLIHITNTHLVTFINHTTTLAAVKDHWHVGLIKIFMPCNIYLIVMLSVPCLSWIYLIFI